MRKYTEEQIDRMVNEMNMFKRFDYYMGYYFDIIRITFKQKLSLLDKIEFILMLPFCFDLKTIVKYYNEYELL